MNITYDGDTVSTNLIYTKESIDEVDTYLSKRSAHVNPAGGLRASAAIDVVNLIYHNLTGD